MHTCMLIILELGEKLMHIIYDILLIVKHNLIPRMLKCEKKKMCPLVDEYSGTYYSVNAFISTYYSICAAKVSTTSTYYKQC